jgi:hypothetical protein
VKVGTRVVVLPARAQVAAAGAPVDLSGRESAAARSRAPAADAARKRYKPEEIAAKLKQVDALVAQGRDIADAVREAGVSEATYQRWRRELGDRAKRASAPEREAPESVAQGGAGAPREQAVHSTAFEE